MENNYLETIEIDEWEIWTDEGWQDFEAVGKTPLLEEYFVKTKTSEIHVSPLHLFFDKNLDVVKTKDLNVGDYIKTENGLEEIIEIKSTGNSCHMYDILDVSNERYYTNGFLSHNCGKSTSFEIFVCWYVLFHAHKGVAILANKAMSSLNILRKIKNAYELLPLWIQSGVKSWNQAGIELENGCRVIAAATSSSAIRSFSINILIIDEMGFVPNNVWSEFFSSVYPTISSSKNSKTIFVSTPNGMNHFWRYWSGATETDPDQNNGFNPIEVKWNQVPGRDHAWYLDKKSKMTEAEFNQEFGGSFLGSSLTLINVSVLEGMKFKKRLKESNLYDLLHHFMDHLYVYENPKKDRMYVMSCDSSKQRKDSVGDPMAIQIIDITKFPYKQVACFHALHNFHYLQAPEVIFQMGKFYNWAFAFIENNEIGQAIVDSLAIDFEYENVYYEKDALAGYRTTKKTKRLGCSTLRSFIEKGKMKLVDMETISQLSTFVSNGKGSYEAEVGYHDDAVMSLVGTLFFVHCPEFDAFDSRKHMAEKLFDRKSVDAGLEEALPAFGIVEADGVSSMGDSVF